MYLDYWQLAAKPFEPDAGAGLFYYRGASHEGALSKLRYAVQQSRGAAALAGPSGVGKTLLIDRLETTLDDPSRPIVRVEFPQLSSRDLLAYLTEKLSAPALDEPPTGSMEQSLRRLEALAKHNAELGRCPVVVIDEAHLLEDTGALETVRLLMNLRNPSGVESRPALTFLLVGQMGLLSSVGRQPTLDERLAVKTLLRGFTAQETAEYCRTRLAAAGAERELFTEESLQRLHALTGGVARCIDRLADLALVVGMADRTPQVGVSQLTSVHDELIAVGAG